MMNNFVPLHVHSDGSNVRFLDSTCKPKNLIQRAQELGFPGIAITDHECLSRAMTFLKLRDKNPNFKIIFGNEIYLIDEKDIKQNPKYYHFILLAKDEVGWQQLKALSARAWDRAYSERGQQRVPTTYRDIEEIIKPNKGHIIGANACVGGFLDTCILEHKVEELNKFTNWCIDTFGKENFRLELQVSDSEEQVACNKVLLQMSEYFGLDYIITTDVHYLQKEDVTIHSIFLKSREDDNRETEKFYKYTYMMSCEEMEQILISTGMTSEQIHKGFENTYKIYEMVENYDFRHSTIVPKTKIPNFTIQHLLKDYYNEFPNLKLFADSDSIHDRYFMYLIERGLIEKHIELTKERVERINIELGVINDVSIGLKEKVSSYFLLMREIIDIAWKYSFVGAGRGSSSGFYTNYLLDLVQCDPMLYNLPYWRFINSVRFELPKSLK